LVEWITLPRSILFSASKSVGGRSPQGAYLRRRKPSVAPSPSHSPKGYGNLGEGNHGFQVYALDRESVRDLSPASYNWLVDLTPPVVAILEPVANTKTVHGKLVDDPVDITTVVGWASVVASAVDALTEVDSVEFRVNGVLVPGASVGPGTWMFEFHPDQNGENLYDIEFTATDEAGNSASTSLTVSGIKTNKKQK
jgi:hypothetical protein